MRDNARFNQQEFETMSMKLLANDTDSIHMTGDSFDKIYKNGKLVDTIVGHNLVVHSFLNLVMCLLKQQSGYTGIQYWAIGSGAEAWDSNLPNPELDATRLTLEIGRVPILPSEIVFLDQNSNVVTQPTNIIQISHTFDTNDCNGTWREFGIFGGNATEDANSGIMINKRHHAVITKTSDMVIERVMKFTLNIA